MRHRFWTIVLCLNVDACATEPPKVQTSLEPAWITTLEGCRIWDPYPRTGEIANWSGSCVDGFVDGKGRVVWKSPRPVSGEGQTPVSDTVDLETTSISDQQMKRGFAQGHGFTQVFDIKTGKIRYTVDGYFEDSRLEEQGTYATPQGLRYVGSFHLGKFDGYGVSQFPTGSRYEGEFRNGFWEGHGLLTWGQGNSYKGDFHLGQADGSGTLTDVGSGSKDKPQLTLTGRWQRGCFLDASRYGCIRLSRN